MKTKKILGIALAVCMTMGLTTVPAMAEDKKTFVFGDTTFNAENEEADINPQNTYAGWACIRYGVGETLFRYSDTMEIEPWIAKEYENIDELTWKITLNDGVVFSNGRVCDGQAVKESLEALVANHERAMSLRLLKVATPLAIQNLIKIGRASCRERVLRLV